VSDGVVTLSNFLSNEHADKIWDYFCGSTFSALHSNGWERFYRFSGAEVVFGRHFCVNAKGKSLGKSVPKALRMLVDKILEDTSCRAFLSACKKWKVLAIKPYLYPAGTSLGWHTDSSKIAACAYYAHPEWRPEWGGELMIDETAMPRTMQKGERSFVRLYHDLDASAVLKSTAGRFVYPTPNRLSFIKGGTLHSINRIDRSAGDACRASVCGFFY